MDMMLKFGFPAIFLLVGIICMLIGKKKDEKVPTFIGIGAAFIGVAWLVVGTF